MYLDLNFTELKWQMDISQTTISNVYYKLLYLDLNFTEVKWSLFLGI